MDHLCKKYWTLSSPPVESDSFRVAFKFPQAILIPSSIEESLLGTSSRDAHRTVENKSLRLQREIRDEDGSLEFMNREVISERVEVNKITQVEYTN